MELELIQFEGLRLSDSVYRIIHHKLGANVSVTSIHNHERCNASYQQ
ncbi:hypothetical protein VCHA52P453_110031 [Vibrio chagasii]|nr:hypothetical protein VCHA39P226_120031 [Vibrio chagasii]CAH6931238.1 hypothetical protein VCHA52P453_110031 [Vibrio chagasii]CAH7301085.1 hypothetical protein VCHA52P456_40031 [Vibrio chagasii]